MRNDFKDKHFYWVWVSMRGRCNNPRNVAYKNYGGRGIKVCEEWSSFEGFCEEMLDSYKEAKEKFGRTCLDRVNNDGPYSRENCRWTTQKENNRNKPLTRFLYKGKEMTLPEIQEMTGISYDTLHGRVVDYGWPIEKAIEVPVHRSHLVRRYSAAGSRYKDI